MATVLRGVPMGIWLCIDEHFKGWRGVFGVLLYSWL